MRIQFDRLWRHKDFMRLWTGQTISVFGSMIGGTALSFTAIVFLQATPLQLGLLNAMEIAPALLAGLFAGAWVDRVRRRPLMIGADLGRALVLATVPLAAVIGVLRIEQVILVALATSLLGILFDLAYQSFLPALVGPENLVEGNSKLSASAAVAEFGGFSLGGWLVQVFGPPMSVLIDAGSFVISAFFIRNITQKEEQPRKVAKNWQPEDTGNNDLISESNPNLIREIREGLQSVFHNPLLRASATVIVVQSLSQGVYGALVVLYMVRGLGFEAGILGMIWAVGGISSLIAAAFAPRITRNLGVGMVMIGGLTVSGISALLIPLANGPTLISAVLLILAQLGDGFYVIYEINQVSLRQKVAGQHMLGRINATMRFGALAAALVGTLLGGVLGEIIGVRPVLLVAALGTILAAGVMALSPIRKL